MSNVLEKIVDNKRLEVAARKRAFPLSEFESQLVPSDKSLFDAINQPYATFICECKKASPSKGLIREPFDLDEIIAAYGPFAAGISVLTDEVYFQGSYEHLEYICQHVSQPVLNKDFFVDPYQVYLARHYNADAVLLMLSVLNDEEYRQLADIAASLQLDVLTEVSNEQEMHRAIALQAPIIGINNRNLRDLSTDLETTKKLVPLLANASHDYVVLSESGIYTHEDVQELASLCNGFLVGSSLMAQRDLVCAVKTLIFGQNKVCGITQLQDAQAAFNAGATHLGFIRVEASPRYISLEQAKSISQQTGAMSVLVYQNHTIEQILQDIDLLHPAAVQLHGQENAVFRQTLRRALPKDIELWQAIALDAQPTDVQLSTAQTLLNEPVCDRVLLDCRSGERTGGTGHQFDWQSISQLDGTAKLILAGGVGPENVADAAGLGVSMLDMNSKLEDAPGVKNATLIQRAFDARRAVSRKTEVKDRKQ